MATPLLTTKLHIPPVRPELVSRPRLIERLNEGLMRRLTLVSAPAGFGKTTLLSEWVHSCGRPVAWVSLDGDDNDLARFLAYFVAALQTLALSQACPEPRRRVEGIEPVLSEACPEQSRRVEGAAEGAHIGEGVLSAFQTPQPPPIESVLTGLINEIAAVPEQFALVLDDYHVIGAEAIHSALTFLLDHLPPQMHLVIATRVDPPLPIPRLRGRGQLTELRVTDLRFTLDEAATFLNQVMGLELSADDVAALETRTEGWVTGLQLAALSMQGREDIPGFLAAFTGSQHYILDYLVEEVLQRQSESAQAFLLQTSILDRMTGPLCEAVTLGCQSKRSGESDGQAMLDRLEHANLFIVPLDDRRHWYRYHHLFADFLRARLHQMWPEQVPGLHRRASEWYERNGQIAEAIDHALSAEDFERAVRLIEQVAEPTLMRSEIATFLRWAEALPDGVMRTRPSLCIFHAWALLLSGRPLDAVESRLQDAEHSPKVEKDAGRISGAAATLRAFIATFRGHLPQAAELSRQALEQLPEDDLFLRSVAAWNMSLAHTVSGEMAASIQAVDQVVRLSQESGNLVIAVAALCQSAEIYIIYGQLRQARTYYQRALELAVDKQGRPLPIAGMAMIGLGEISREWNDLQAAAHYLTEGIELTRRLGEIWILDGYIALARVRQAQGDVDGAHDTIQKARQFAMKFDVTELDDLLVAAHQARLWVAQDDLEATMRWVEEQGLKVNINPAELEEEGSSELLQIYYLREFERITLAWALISHGRADEALALLALLLPGAEQRGWNKSVIEIQTLKALALQAQGDTPQAITALEKALSLAEPEGFVRLFVDEGAPMGELLRQAAAQGIAVDYVGKLLAALEEETKGERWTKKPLPSSLAPGPSSALVEPLSERELEVLGLIAAGLSNREIAQKLFVALSTVKTHINNIYRKLDVSKRTQAVARAKELNLL